jgi:hypothetical protein
MRKELAGISYSDEEAGNYVSRFVFGFLQMRMRGKKDGIIRDKCKINSLFCKNGSDHLIFKNYCERSDQLKLAYDGSLIP